MFDGGGFVPFPNCTIVDWSRVQFGGREREDQESDRLDKIEKFRQVDQTREKHPREDQIRGRKKKREQGGSVRRSDKKKNR